MSEWKLSADTHNRRQWTKGEYCITEMRRPIDEHEYFCYHKLNFLTVRMTPELAKELCDIHAGKL